MSEALNRKTAELGPEAALGESETLIDDERFFHSDYVDGHARAFSAKVEHNAKNVSDVEVGVLEIENKR